MAKILFSEIETLLTLKSAAKKQGRLITEKDLSIKKKQCIIVEKGNHTEAGKIVWIGSEKKIPSEYIKQIEKKVSLNGQTVIPAFAECHTHTVFSGDRAYEFESRNQGVSYLEIARKGGGILSTVKSVQKSSFEELKKLSVDRVKKFVKQGVTCLEIKSGYGLCLKDEVKMLQVIRALGKMKNSPEIISTYLGAHAKPKNFESYQSYIELIVKKDLPMIARQKLADRVDIFIEKGFFTLQQGKKLLSEAQKQGLHITVHADQLSNSGACLLAVEMGAQSADHLVELSNSDIKKVAKSDTVAVLLPAADYYLKMKYPPARKLLDAGARVALATDFNPGSSPTQDLAFVGLLARQEMKMSLAEVIVSYTLNAAAALGREASFGSIEVGKKANFLSLNSDWTELFYHVGDMPVNQVFHNGRLIN